MTCDHDFLDWCDVIVFRRLGGELIALNPDLIERVEVTPDTVVTMVDDRKFLVAESLDEVLDLIVDYRAYVIARSNDLSVTAGAGRPTLHVVPNDHITSQENHAAYGRDVNGVDLDFEPEPDGRVHLEFRRSRAESEAEADDGDVDRGSRPKNGPGIGFGGRG